MFKASPHWIQRQIQALEATQQENEELRTSLQMSEDAVRAALAEAEAARAALKRAEAGAAALRVDLDRAQADLTAEVVTVRACNRSSPATCES